MGKPGKKSNNGLGNNLFAWQIRIDSRRRLYALFARGERKNITVDGCVYYSDNGAMTWNKMSLPEKVNGPHDLLLNPDRSGYNVFILLAQDIRWSDSKGGVLKTTDRGKDMETDIR